MSYGPFENEEEFLSAYQGELGNAMEDLADGFADENDIEVVYEDPDGEEYFENLDNDEDEETDEETDHIAEEITRLEEETGVQLGPEEQNAVAELARENWGEGGPNVEGAYAHLLGELDYGYEDGYKAAVEGELDALERRLGSRVTAKEIAQVVDELPQGEVPDLVEKYHDEFKKHREHGSEARKEWLGEVASEAMPEDDGQLRNGAGPDKEQSDAEIEKEDRVERMAAAMDAHTEAQEAVA